MLGLTLGGALAVTVAMVQTPSGLELRRVELPRVQVPDLSPLFQKVTAMVRPASATDTPTPTLEPTEPPTPTPEPTFTPTAEPPTATPEPTNTPVPPAPLVHTVARGETLRTIAQKYGVTIAELMAANNLSSEVLRVGQQLVIPGQTQSAPSPAATLPAVHVVQPGENLLIIAQRYGLSVTALMEANGLTSSDVLRVGQELKIPGGAAPTPTATLEPTFTPTPTVTATLTPEPAPTANTTFEFPAPNLLTPADGAIVQGAEDVILNWTSVGLLGDDTWYVVRIWRDDPSEPTPPTGWTRTTAWRIPASFQPQAGAKSRRFWWSVTVMRLREGQTPLAISPESAKRWFEWQ